MERRELTFTVTRSYRDDVLRFRVPLWVAWTVGLTVALLVLAALLVTVTGASRLARLARLAQRNRQLEVEFAQVSSLRVRLQAVEEQSRKLAVMLGVDKSPPPVNWDSPPLDAQALPEWLKGKVWGAEPTPRLVPVESYAVSRSAQSGHPAVDLAAAQGAPVRACADGVVKQRGEDQQYGRFLLLEHGQGYESYYGHLQDWNVSEGDSVRVGHTVGWVGTTGRSTAPHLHFEIRKNGKRIDPGAVLKF